MNRSVSFWGITFSVICVGIVFAQMSLRAAVPAVSARDDGVVTLDVNGYYPLSGHSNIDVRRYVLHFSNIDYNAETLTARAEITIRAVRNLTALTGISLDFAPPGGSANSISALTVNNSPRPFSLETCIGGSAANHETYLKIIPSSTITAGTEFTVALSWSGKPNKETTSYGSGWGMDFQSSPDVVATMNQPNSAHLWFPCNDMPEDKATCDIYGTVDLEQWAISVGELAGVTTNGSQRTFHWHTSFKVAPYLIAFNAGDYQHIPDVGGAPVPVEAWYYSGARSSWKAGAERARDNLNTYANLYGTYPFEKYAHVQFWNKGAGYMEHQTISSMKDGNNKQYTAHELAHQWWGDYVTCETWNDLWLNESFAVYSEYLASRGSGDRDGIATNLPARSGLDWRRKLNQPGYGSISDLFRFSLTYNRGAWTLHHIRNYLGEDKFWPAILHYRAEYADSTANTEQFRDTLATGAFADQTEINDFKAFFDRYLADGQPKLNIKWHARTLNGNTHICMFNNRADGFSCGDVVVSKVTFTDNSTRSVFHRFATNATAALVIITNKIFASISVNNYGDFPCKTSSDLSISGGDSVIDSDGDSLPDYWESATMGTLAYSGTDDPNANGADNATEYANGTLPLEKNVVHNTPSPSPPLVAYEGFEDYTDDAGVIGLSGGRGWTGHWVDFYEWEAGDGSVKARSAPMGYMSGEIFVAGGANAIRVTPDTNAYVSRSLSELTGAVYVSFLVTPESSSVPWGALGTPPGYKESGFLLQGTRYKTVVQDTANSASVSTAVIGQTEFVVLRYDWDGSTYAGVSLWINPHSSTEPAAADLTQTGSIGANSISEIYFGGYQGVSGTAYWLDEIRVGTNWSSVVTTGTIPSLQACATENTMEIGDSTSVAVSLSSQPAYNVTISVGTEASRTNLFTTTESLLFTTENWRQPQIVTIQSLDNQDAPVTASFTFTPDVSAITPVTQTFAEIAEVVPPLPPNLNCYDDFGGNDTGWDSSSAWSGDLTVTRNGRINPLIYSNEFVYSHGGGNGISITSDVDGDQSKIFSRAIQQQTNTFYMSFLARFNETPSGSYNYLALGQKSSANDSGAALGIINNSSGTGCAFINDGNTSATLQSLGTALHVDETYLIVAKYIWDNTSAAFTGMVAHINPTSTVAELAEHSVAVNGSPETFDSVDLQYYGRADADFDEIRVGHSWTDVVPANNYSFKIIHAALSPEYFTITFNSDFETLYEIRRSASPSGEAQWESESVQRFDSAIPGGFSTNLIQIQGSAENTTTIRIQRNHLKAFYKIFEVTE